MAGQGRAGQGRAEKKNVSHHWTGFKAFPSTPFSCTSPAAFFLFSSCSFNVFWLLESSPSGRVASCFCGGDEDVEFKDFTRIFSVLGVIMRGTLSDSKILSRISMPVVLVCDGAWLLLSSVRDHVCMMLLAAARSGRMSRESKKSSVSNKLKAEVSDRLWRLWSEMLLVSPEWALSARDLGDVTRRTCKPCGGCGRGEGRGDVEPSRSKWGRVPNIARSYPDILASSRAIWNRKANLINRNDTARHSKYGVRTNPSRVRWFQNAWHALSRLYGPVHCHKLLTFVQNV